MASESISEANVDLRIENIGGIESLEANFTPGVTILSGSNASNRTSALEAIAAAIGSNQASLKSDAAEGTVEMEVGNTVYTRTLTRGGDNVHINGDPLLDDSTAADLFAILLESNRARRAVELQENLRDLIMEPVDIVEIETEIEELKRKRDKITEDVERREQHREQLPALQEQVVQLEDEIEELKSEKEDLEEEIAAANLESDEAEEIESELQEKMEELQEKRDKHDQLERRIEQKERKITQLKEDIDEAEQELAETEDIEEGQVEDIASRIGKLEKERNRIESQLNAFQSVIGFNEDLIDNDQSRQLLKDLEDDPRTTITRSTSASTSGGGIAAGQPEKFICWTCGTLSTPDRVEQTLDILRELRAEKFARRDEIAEEIDNLRDKKDEIHSQAQRKEDLERKVRDLESQLSAERDELDSLEDTLEDLRSEIENLEAEVEKLKEEERSELLKLQTELNEKEYAINRKRKKLDDVKEEVQTIESEKTEIEDLKEERKRIRSELVDLRSTVSELEDDAVESFNHHMDNITELLQYNNIARVWIEKRGTETADIREEIREGQFDLNVVRETDEGSYQDTYANLSESEREVTGLVFALAGYLAHKVYEDVPFMLLDSIEAIDSPRIAKLVDHFSEFPEYLVVALLEGDAAALPEEYNYITSFES